MILFAADAFVEHYVGGAELTTEALIKSTLMPTGKAITSQLNPQIMEKFKHSFWIFGNFANLSEECMMYAAKNLNYSVLEYDYKFCKYRSPGKHIVSEGECDCHASKGGKIVALFLAKSKINWWMSEQQKQKQKSAFAFLQGLVLSSVFSDETLDYLESLDTTQKNDKWIILNSQSWIKGVKEAVEYAKQNNLDYELVWGLEHKELLKKLASSKGLIFFPKAGDTCPRMVIEAKLLDCDLKLNDNVQHKDEAWFQTKESCLQYLRTRTKVFWDEINKHLDFMPKKSSLVGPKYFIVTPFYNAESFLPKCISAIKDQSYANFECVLIDDMSSDDSFRVAKELTIDDPRFKIIKNDQKRFALGNIASTIESLNCDPEDVVILLDGDDWFSNNLVLSHLNKFYNDKDCWMTYGSYVLYPYGVRGPEPSEYPEAVVDNNTYRKDVWRASHLRTFRKKVWDKIEHDDLKDTDGDYYKVAYDQAIMLPLLEMSGPRSRYVPEILHVYNKINPLNVDKVYTKQQVETANKIRQQKSYERLS